MIMHLTKFCFALVFTILFAGVDAYSQKGVDSQTQKIKDDGNKVTTRSSDATRSFDWGKGKTKVRDRLANPYKLASRRDVLIETIVEVLRENNIIVDDASTRMKDGIIITQPFVFAKGSVIAQNELNRYAVLDSSYSTWTRARYTLTIEVQSIDGVQNNVSVVAKIEGRSGNGLMSEWLTLRSSGAAEDEFISKLVERVTGSSPEPVQDTLR
ncbi:MAG: hypothetical protein IPL32_15435 [Chloracidobacterium sp.]|nr:hypothetical protein [Chloracidobacterium sp.]